MSTTAQMIGVHVSLSHPTGPLSQITQAILNRLPESSRVDSAAEARLVLADSTERSLCALNEGACVIQLPTTRNSEGLAAGLVEYFSDRFRIASNRPTLLDDALRIISELRPQLELRSPFDPKFVSPAEIIGQRILVVDDSPLHRAVAVAQFGERNQLEVYAGYGEALQRIQCRNQPLDIVLSDLMMPTEAFTLTEEREAKIGQPFNAGGFVVLAALQARVAKIALVTTGNPHRVPELAAIKLLARQFRSTESLLWIEDHPSTVQGGKDWAEVLAAMVDS